MIHTIKLNNGYLATSTLVAGSLAECSINNALLPDNTTAYAIVTDDHKKLPIAVSGKMDIDNDYKSNLDLLTDVIYETFRIEPVTARRWIYIEVIDIANRQSLGYGHAVMLNSALIAGASSAVPELSPVLTRADFAALDDLQRPSSLTSTADMLAQILQILKG